MAAPPDTSVMRTRDPSSDIPETHDQLNTPSSRSRVSPGGFTFTPKRSKPWCTREAGRRATRRGGFPSCRELDETSRAFPSSVARQIDRLICDSAGEHPHSVVAVPGEPGRRGRDLGFAIFPCPRGRRWDSPPPATATLSPLGEDAKGVSKRQAGNGIADRVLEPEVRRPRAAGPRAPGHPETGSRRDTTSSSTRLGSPPEERDTGQRPRRVRCPGHRDGSAGSASSPRDDTASSRAGGQVERAGLPALEPRREDLGGLSVPVRRCKPPSFRPR